MHRWPENTAQATHDNSSNTNTNTTSSSTFKQRRIQCRLVATASPAAASPALCSLTALICRRSTQHYPCMRPTSANGKCFERPDPISISAPAGHGLCWSQSQNPF